MIVDGNKIKKLMDKNLFTVEDLSKESGIATKTIVNARNSSSVFPSTVRKLCAALKCEPADILPDD